MKRLTITEMQELAKERGGECLSERYQNNNQSLLWRCKKGHIWKANANNIKNGKWCAQCAGNISLNIEEMHSIAKKHGGKCLSTEYLNSKTKLKWECQYEHTWFAVPTNVKSGSWCNICARASNANKLRYNIEDLHKIAQANGGECLSPTYINAQMSMRWKCREGHIWQNCANNVRRGQWCDICSSKRSGLLRRNTIEEMHRLAEKRGGLCLSKEYIGNKAHLRWQCEKGHQWEAAPSSIKSSQSWCMKCGFESSANLRKKDIQIMRDVAENRGGECLSPVHKSVNAKLLWRCANGHEWSAVPVKILRGSWCPLCSSHLGERICREYLEQIFGYPFPKSRPNWLFNSEGNRAELDGYCSELNLAFEHHGQYHYQIDKLYSKTKVQVEKRQKEDRFKEQLCLKNGVKVVVIPEIFTITALENVMCVIENECVSKGIKIPPSYNPRMSIDLKKAYASNYASIAFQKLKEIAVERGGQCLSISYERSSAKMKWQCKNGHIFEVPPNAVKRGSWCLKCSGHERLSIAEMKAIAEERGGKCLSEEYTNAHTKLKWQCAVGHIWKAIANSVKHRGTWCRRCSAALNYKNFLQKRSLKQN